MACITSVNPIFTDKIGPLIREKIRLHLNKLVSYPRREHTRINGQFLLSRDLF